LTFREAKALAPSIAEFSELAEFLDLPLRTYSAGMFVRLAFAISTAVQPEIVVMDEMIAAGDQGFIEKSHERISSLLGNTEILVMASQVDAILKMFCNKVLWLEKGRIKMLGPTVEVLTAYAGSKKQ
jgi:ABC-type polysaccharide/polyol phosphate transport system ATPase subunit